MRRYDPPLIALAVCLSALAGFVDALAYTTLGGFFVSFMSGNTTRLGVSIAEGLWGDAQMAASIIMAFVSGVILSSVIVRAWPGRRKTAVMLAVTGLLTIAAAVASLHPGPLALIIIGVALGTENGVFNRDGEVTIGLTYMTGTLVRMGQRLAGALMGDTDRWAWLLYFCLWLGFIAGVVIGARVHFGFGWHALWFAAAASALLTLITMRVARLPAPGEYAAEEPTRL